MKSVTIKAPALFFIALLLVVITAVIIGFSQDETFSIMSVLLGFGIGLAVFWVREQGRKEEYAKV